MRFIQKLVNWLNPSLETQIKTAEDFLVQHAKLDYGRITWQQLKDFHPVQTSYTDVQQSQFHKECELLSQNNVLKKVIDDFVVEAKEYLLLQSSSLDQNFKRGEISGVIKLRDQLNRYATQAADIDSETIDVDDNYQL